MKKGLLIPVMLLAAGMVFAGGATEEGTRQEYEAKGFSSRDAWLYEFNSIANDVVKYGKEIVGGESFSPSLDKMNFDSACLKYKVLLDMGVELAYINDKTRKQQLSKAEDERKKVAQYLSAQSSGLGLE